MGGDPGRDTRTRTSPACSQSRRANPYAISRGTAAQLPVPLSTQELHRAAEGPVWPPDLLTGRRRCARIRDGCGGWGRGGPATCPAPLPASPTALLGSDVGIPGATQGFPAQLSTSTGQGGGEQAATRGEHPLARRILVRTAYDVLVAGLCGVTFAGPVVFPLHHSAMLTPSRRRLRLVAIPTDWVGLT